MDKRWDNNDNAIKKSRYKNQACAYYFKRFFKVARVVNLKLVFTD